MKHKKKKERLKKRQEQYEKFLKDNQLNPKLLKAHRRPGSINK